METVDIKEYKAIKDGEVTPKHLINLLHESMEKGETNPEVIIYVCKMKDGTIHINHSDGYHTDKVGLLQIGISDLIDEMRD